MIVQIVNETGAASVKELSVRFAITEDSIRKDLTALQKKGLIKKTYGGALKLDEDSQERYVSQRKGKYLPDKQKIAKKALHIMKDGDLIFLDISTTSIEIAKLLKTSGLSLTVVTNMVEVMLIMAGDTYNRLIFIGGTFSEGKDGFVGSLTNREIAQYRFDKAFIGVVGIDRKQGSAMTYSLEDAMTKDAVIHNSRAAYLLLESRKLKKHGNYVYASLTDFTGTLSEQPLPKEAREYFEGYGLSCL